MSELANIKSVIVQAGGRGQRMGELTRNRPKCLISVGGQSLLFRLREHFPEAGFVVIGDYQYDVLARYIETFDKKQQYHLVRAKGVGDVAGIPSALDCIQDGPFVLVWSDLLLGELPALDVCGENNIGITREFSCRWSFERGACRESPSSTSGVAGLFTFRNKDEIRGLPESGQFLEYVRGVEMTPFFVDGTIEIGSEETYRSLPQPSGRPYNRLSFSDESVEKTCSDPVYAHKIHREASWYEKVRALGFERIPEVLSPDPLVMSRVNGNHPMDVEPSAVIFGKILDSVEELHSLGDSCFDLVSCQEAHVELPMRALKGIMTVLPREREFRINGRLCINPFEDDEIFDVCRASFSERDFRVSHGECTFSNTLVGDDGVIYLIDPSPCYGFVEQPFGNPLYDWSKIYYSVVGRFDMFNRRQFELKLDGDDVRLDIAESGWEKFENPLIERVHGGLREVQIMHALEWFLLSAHATDDYDSILGAFFRGIALLNEVLEG